MPLRVKAMNMADSIAKVRRRIGLIDYANPSDLEYATQKIINENREVFDRLAKA